MSWIISWTSLIPTLLILSASLAWWFTEPKNARINLIAAVGVVLFCWAVAPELSRDLSYSLYVSSLDSVTALHLETFVLRNANMLLVGAAVVWLVGRAFQTLRKPVPELINTLGVDVPDPPDVSLAGIRADAATVNWTRPAPNRSVVKFLIQVNGVVVGEVAANQEPAIVVSGLKPDHFYNVRVIAVGSNNFQGGSRVIRLRTFARDGRPQLGNSRLPSNFTAEEPPATPHGESMDESGGARTAFPALEMATVTEGIASPARDGNTNSGPGPRRNTVTRKHSPSTTSIDQSTREDLSAYAKKTLPELTEKFESIRKETEEVLAQIAKEEAENRKVLEELEAEKKGKRKEQKKKEEQTEKLKRDVNSTDRAMRNALQRKGQRERTLKEKQGEREKYHENIAKWERGVGEMRKDRESFDQQRKDLEEERDQKAEAFRGDNNELQAECTRLEQELKERRDQVRELEEARKKLPGGEDDGEWREKDAELKREWHRRHRELSEQLVFETKRSRGLDEHIRALGAQLQAIPQPSYGLYTPPNASGLEFDNPTLTQLKRRSRNSNTMSNVSISSPLPAYSQIDPILSAPTGFASSRSLNAPPGFAPGPFMDLSADMDFRGSSAPLSPSATALLPSNILDDFDDDDDDPSPTTFHDPEPFLQSQRASPEQAPQSPASSGRALSILSSPHGSTSNLPFPPFSNEISERMVGTLPSPTIAETPQHKGFFWQRSKTVKEEGEKEPPLLGSLKQGQSQSFPRQTDDPDMANKRRISISGSWNVFNRNSVGPEITEGQATTNTHAFARSLNPFSRRPTGGLFDRDPSSPRPTSIASSDFPRPSTDSGSIWGPPMDASTLNKNSRLWSPDNAPWSRNPSRRPSLHGSPSALKTTLASADDEILDDEEMLSNVDVGVIGSRPPTQSANKAASAALGRLNPNAPAFIGSLFKSNPEKQKEKEVKEKAKAEKKKANKEKAAEKKKEKEKEAATVPDTPSQQTQNPIFEMDSPADSRKSRDGASVHTLHSSVSISESRDSLTLDQSFSNTPSEPASAGLSGSFKDEGVVRKLFRKGSSSKFSLPGRLGGNSAKENITSAGGLFKKGPSSVASTAPSDRIDPRSSIGDFEDLGDEAMGVLTGVLGKSYECSSPGLGPTSAAAAAAKGTTKEGGTAASRWLSSFGKKGKKNNENTKESFDLERAHVGGELDGLVEEKV
ncbi:hypothetical protein QC762_111540 [Podospora pseudocomata]|uniref:Fibronectin type-III domain-containing protein n=1 Tax=Podospora pseudocomata TaxID=2093779 RepID=A0ABR0GUY7_9PEZI|nr:hypothetical protein QC762_111540 [Podospora pseudocomata]